MSLFIEEFMELVAERQQIIPRLSKKQKRFLKAIRGTDVTIEVSERSKNDPQYKQFIKELNEMYQMGMILSLHFTIER